MATDAATTTDQVPKSPKKTQKNLLAFVDFGCWMQTDFFESGSPRAPSIYKRKLVTQTTHMITFLYAILSCESLLVMLLFKNLLTSVDPIPGTSFCRSTFPLAKALPKVKTFFCFCKEYLMLAQKAGYIVLVPCTYLKILNFSPESTISCPPSSATCNGSKRYKSKCRSFKLSILAEPVELLIRTKLNSINH